MYKVLKTWYHKSSANDNNNYNNQENQNNQDNDNNKHTNHKRTDTAGSIPDRY